MKKLITALLLIVSFALIGQNKSVVKKLQITKLKNAKALGTDAKGNVIEVTAPGIDTSIYTQDGTIPSGRVITYQPSDNTKITDFKEEFVKDDTNSFVGKRTKFTKADGTTFLRSQGVGNEWNSNTLEDRTEIRDAYNKLKASLEMQDGVFKTFQTDNVKKHASMTMRQGSFNVTTVNSTYKNEWGIAYNPTTPNSKQSNMIVNAGAINLENKSVDATGTKETISQLKISKNGITSNAEIWEIENGSPQTLTTKAYVDSKLGTEHIVSKEHNNDCLSINFSTGLYIYKNKDYSAISEPHCFPTYVVNSTSTANLLLVKVSTIVIGGTNKYVQRQEAWYYQRDSDGNWSNGWYSNRLYIDGAWTPW